MAAASASLQSIVVMVPKKVNKLSPTASGFSAKLAKAARSSFIVMFLVIDLKSSCMIAYLIIFVNLVSRIVMEPSELIVP